MNQEKVGEFIKKLRKDNNLTQSEFANKLGVTYQAVSKWENGKNIPDIATLKEISNLFKVDIDEIISGNQKEKKKKKIVIILSIIIPILLLVILLLSISVFNNKNNDSNFEFKVINASCDKFNINGSIAYNKEKSYIYISSIEFCGDEDIVYSEIECTLYESYKNMISKIATCHKGMNQTLKEHLKEVKISSDNYKSICNKFEDSELYLEIKATHNNKTTTYKIPLELDNSCK